MQNIEISRRLIRLLMATVDLREDSTHEQEYCSQLLSLICVALTLSQTEVVSAIMMLNFVPYLIRCMEPDRTIVLRIQATMVISFVARESETARDLILTRNVMVTLTKVSKSFSQKIILTVCEFFFVCFIMYYQTWYRNSRVSSCRDPELIKITAQLLVNLCRHVDTAPSTSIPVYNHGQLVMNSFLGFVNVLSSMVTASVRCHLQRLYVVYCANFVVYCDVIIVVINDLI